MGKLDVDDSEIESIIGITVNTISEDFSPEWLSFQFMNSVINGVNGMVYSWNELKATAKHYITSNAEVSDQKEPDTIEPGFSNTNLDNSYDPTQLTENNNWQPTVHNDSAIVNTNTHGLNIRTGKGTDTEIITSAAKGSTVTIIEKDDGSGWTKIRTSDGTEGYVATEWLKMNNKSLSSSTPSSSGVAPSSSSKYYTVPKGNANVTADSLRIRSGAGTSNKTIDFISKGASVTVMEDCGNGWSKVSYGDGKTGYVSNKYLSTRKGGN